MTSHTRLMIVIVLAAVLWPMRASAAGAATTTSAAVPTAAEVSDLALRLSIQSNHLTVGQPILVRVDVVNLSAQTTYMDVQTPWDAVQIHLLGNGTTVTPTAPSAFIHWGFQPRVTLQAGQTFTYQWSDPSVGVGYFYPLSYWGFKQTLPAGHYVLYVSPAHAIGRRAGKWIAPARALVSNKIEFTVSP